MDRMQHITCFLNVLLPCFADMTSSSRWEMALMAVYGELGAETMDRWYVRFSDKP